MTIPWQIIIPARYASTRMPQKPLQLLYKKPLIVRVFENLKELASKECKITVATDHIEVKKVCEDFSIPVEMTSASHQSGTDRCFELASKFPSQYILNVQGDEPFIAKEDLLNLMKFCEKNPPTAINTLYYPSTDYESFCAPHNVKAVLKENSEALYFSRSLIPYQSKKTFKKFNHHMGIYAYSFQALKNFCQLRVSHLESIEKLEQLRALENGIPVFALKASKLSLGIDTLEELQLAEKEFQKVTS